MLGTIARVLAFRTVKAVADRYSPPRRQESSVLGTILLVIWNVLFYGAFFGGIGWLCYKVWEFDRSLRIG
jgi:preprotein translocase subunit SecE